MKYRYKCTNEGCSQCETVVVIEKPMSECSNIEHCKTCGCELERVYTAPSVSTGDGFKR